MKKLKEIIRKMICIWRYIHKIISTITKHLQKLKYITKCYMMRFLTKQNDVVYKHMAILGCFQEERFLLVKLHDF